MLNKTFTPPPCLDSDVLVCSDIWDHHARHSPDHPIFTFDDGGGNGGIRQITWSEASRAMHAAGRTFVNALKKGGNTTEANDTEARVIAILAVSDIVTSWASITGIIRAGYTVLLLSPRNSPPALAHLLQAAKCQMIVHSTDSFVKESLSATLSLLGYPAILCPLPGFSEIYGRQDCVEQLPPVRHIKPDDIALISHTSGSTSFPKPRFLTHRTFLQYGKSLHSEGLDMAGKTLGVHGLPHFHMMGAVTTVGWSSVSGLVLGVLAPSDPPIVPTPQRVLDAATSSQVDTLLAVPSFCEEWSMDEEAIGKLLTFEVVIFSGGPLNRRVGKTLVSKGVNIQTLYGLTELGGVSGYPVGPVTEDWEYMKLSKHINTRLIPQGDTEDVYELIIFESPNLRPCIFNMELDGAPAFATGDLFSPHPSGKKDLWRICGRKDDQIMHSTGEKTNPGPMETIISKHSAISKALMFGREQFNTGVIVEPSATATFDHQNEDSRKAYIDEIWPNVEEANARAPSHSRIFREMIIIANPEKRFKVTPKQTIRRTAVLNDYAEEIAEAYRSFYLSSSPDISTPPNSWSAEDCTDFVKAIVTRVLGHDLLEDDDFFSQGVNSLHAVYIRNVIHRMAKSANLDMAIETNMIYELPTARTLGSFLSRAAAGHTQSSTADVANTRARVLSQFVREFTAEFRVHTGDLPWPEKETILVTGTTGSLGINVLKTLISLDSVQRVYAFNRGSSSGKKALDRHIAAAALQGIDVLDINSAKIVFLEGDAAASNMELPDDVVEGIRNSVTSIIHLAWKVDFNMTIKSFVPQLQGVSNMIDLALSSHLEQVPPIVFASSISDIQHHSTDGVVPAQIFLDPKNAIGTGYGESKWVASRVLEIAREKTPLRPVIVRIGQLCGSQETGRWNAWEWFPSIVRSGKATGCLPELKGEISWIPVDVAARTIVDLRHAGERAPVVNLAHPSPVPSQDILRPISQALELPVRPYSEWLECLKDLKDSYLDRAAALDEIPALKLFDFYQSLASAPQTAGMGGLMEVKLDTTLTISVSETLACERSRPLGKSDALGWIHHWL